jgi:carboxypeptidase Q
MRDQFLAAVAAAFLASTPSSAEVPGRADPQVAELKRSIFVGPSMQTLEALSDGFGPRLTGSDSYRGSADWAAEQFRALGLKNVRLEPFTVPAGWTRGGGRARIAAPEQTPITLESVGWSPPTPAGGIDAEVLWIDDVSPANLARLAPEIKGRVVILDTAKVFKGGAYAAVLDVHAAYEPIKRAGGVAILFPNPDPGNALGEYVDLLTGGKILPLPMAEIGMEETLLIRRLARRGPVRLEFSFENKVTPAFQDPNVIAEVRGREKPDEWVLVGGHLDSWDYGRGAADNGVGATAVLEAARAIAALGRPPRRSIRFVLWGGEEPGQLGSQGYARSHPDEIRRLTAVLNADTGAGRPIGWRVADRPDLVAALKPLAARHLADLDAEAVLDITTCSTDHCAFLVRGVPTLNLLVDRTVYEQIHHRASDTVDKINEVELKADVAVVAVTAYMLAEQETAIAPHQSPAEVAALLKRVGLDESLVRLGRWSPEPPRN